MAILINDGYINKIKRFVNGSHFSFTANYQQQKRKFDYSL